MSIESILTRLFRYKRKDSLPFYPYNQGATREVLAQAMGEAGYKIGVEVGVYYGAYSKILCEKIPGLKLTCIDPWKPFSRRRSSEERMNRVYQIAQNTLSQYDVNFMRMPSIDGAKQIPDESLDFVYIDAMHDFDNVMMDIILWTPKVRLGGVVAGHDFSVFYQGGVMDAVYAYTRAHNVWPWYVTGMTVSKEEINPSWFWVKR